MSSSRSRMERMTIGTARNRGSFRSARSTSYPSRYGMTRSLTMRSGAASAATWRAWCPSVATTTSYPGASRSDPTKRAVTGSSSATRILLVRRTSAPDRESEARAERQRAEVGAGGDRGVAPSAVDLEADPVGERTADQPVHVDEALARRLLAVELVALEPGLERSVVGPHRRPDRSVGAERADRRYEPLRAEVSVVEVVGEALAPHDAAREGRRALTLPDVPGRRFAVEADVAVGEIAVRSPRLDLNPRCCAPRGAEREARHVDLGVEDRRGIDERVVGGRGPRRPRAEGEGVGGAADRHRPLLAVRARETGRPHAQLAAMTRAGLPAQDPVERGHASVAVHDGGSRAVQLGAADPETEVEPRRKAEAPLDAQRVVGVVVGIPEMVVTDRDPWRGGLVDRGHEVADVGVLRMGLRERSGARGGSLSVPRIEVEVGEAHLGLLHPRIRRERPLEVRAGGGPLPHPRPRLRDAHERLGILRLLVEDPLVVPTGLLVPAVPRVRARRRQAGLVIGGILGENLSERLPRLHEPPAPEEDLAALEPRLGLARVQRQRAVVPDEGLVEAPVPGEQHPRADESVHVPRVAREDLVVQGQGAGVVPRVERGVGGRRVRERPFSGDEDDGQNERVTRRKHPAAPRRLDRSLTRSHRLARPRLLGPGGSLVPERIAPWLALHLLPGIGPVSARRALSRQPDPEEVAFRWPASAWSEVPGVDGATAEGVVAARPLLARRVEAEWRAAARRNVRIVTPDTEDYPSMIAELHDAPIVLYMRGEVPQGRVRVALVGARRASAYGKEVARGLAAELACRGVEVISGGARGIDTCAHRAALEAGGRTVAVMGSGLACPYPAENEELFDAMAESGGLISEFPMAM